MTAPIDIAEPDFERWIAQVLDHPVAVHEQAEWYWEKGLEFIVSSPLRLVRHVNRLCSHFGAIAPRYSIDQVNQGIWYLLAARGEFGGYLMDRGIDRDERIACIQSMSHVYSDYVALVPPTQEVPSSFDMWWDMLCDSFWNSVGRRISGPPTEEEIAQMMHLLDDSPTFEQLQARLKGSVRRKFAREDLDEEESALHDAMLQTLEQIVLLPDLRCQQCALHGLGHLRHPYGCQLVQNYIDAHRTKWTESGIEWLERCRDGTVM